jgi:hypothetical protein
MATHRLKPDSASFNVDAVQWFKVGDHPNVTPMHGAGNMIDEACGHPSHAHGFLRTPEGTAGVCPGDWIVRKADGTLWRFRKDEFADYYEPVE